MLKARYGSLPQLSLMIQEMGEEELKIGTVWTDICSSISFNSLNLPAHDFLLFSPLQHFKSTAI